ncbi:MAG: Xaa-Pro peptidase family protein [Dehalococcoidia bacterium]|nr:Xaa-Pro peptidase family protein [Dehalococcoidia bacterium]
MRDRLDRLRGQFRERELDAMLISAPENRRYLSGFTGSAGYLFVSAEQAVLVTDSRYTEQAAGQATEYRVIQVRGGWDWLLEQLKESGAKRLGFESQDMTVATYNGLLEVLKKEESLGQVSMVAAPGMAEEQRAIKDGSELAALRKAIHASDSAMEGVRLEIREGMTEREVAWRMESAMRDFGSEGTSFDTIVAAGPNGAMAHHMPSDRPIGRGEPIVIDMGAKVDGYCSDLTRTVMVGEPDETFRKVYDIVLGAQLTAISTVKAGMTAGECDGLARSVITEAGFGDKFGHGLGHGVGLAVHEDPRVGPKSSDPLAPNTVFTVEPGIYITGWGGVRIEDIVLMEGEGATPLSKASK